MHGAELAQHWVQELTGLGYYDPGPAQIPASAAQPVRVGTLDRDGATRDVLARLGAARSGWNAADVRGQVEQLIAASGIIARDHNLVADTPLEARNQWIDVFNRERADLGPAHAARLSAQEAVSYATHRPLGMALSDLRDAWNQEHALAQQLSAARHARDQLTQVVPLRTQHDAQVAAGRATYEQARGHATQAAEHADQLAALVGRDTFQLAGRLRQAWDTSRPAARAAAQTIAAGNGRIGQHRGAVRRATGHLQGWAQQWRPIVPRRPGFSTTLWLGPRTPWAIGAAAPRLGTTAARLGLDVSHDPYLPELAGRLASLRRAGPDVTNWPVTGWGEDDPRWASFDEARLAVGDDAGVAAVRGQRRDRARLQGAEFAAVHAFPTATHGSGGKRLPVARTVARTP